MTLPGSLATSIRTIRPFKRLLEGSVFGYTNEAPSDDARRDPWADLRTKTDAVSTLLREKQHCSSVGCSSEGEPSEGGDETRLSKEPSKACPHLNDRLRKLELPVISELGGVESQAFADFAESVGKHPTKESWVEATCHKSKNGRVFLGKSAVSSG
jgi:hypothetical protein